MDRIRVLGLTQIGLTVGAGVLVVSGVAGIHIPHGGGNTDWFTFAVGEFLLLADLVWVRPRYRGVQGKRVV